jgi:hypothetical protein
METLKKFKVLGITRDFNTCDCCGKTNLLKVVAIMDLDHEVMNHFGINCAASIEKYDSLEAAKLAKKEISKSVSEYMEVEKLKGRRLFNILKKHFGTVPITGGYKINISPALYDKNWNSYRNLKNESEFKIIE